MACIQGRDSKNKHEIKLSYFKVVPSVLKETTKHTVWGRRQQEEGANLGRVAMLALRPAGGQWLTRPWRPLTCPPGAGFSASFSPLIPYQHCHSFQNDEEKSEAERGKTDLPTCPVGPWNSEGARQAGGSWWREASSSQSRRLEKTFH